ncbi:intercellular adhesion molecule 5-like isoform X2 [Stegostoma tigrinum]|uniref:intercellular adhesion molecule 5-like isoform X2 n=1 Tax=Stegostoma tigrinum TaxID=3053191 RepID=UPI0028708086|nr:intercellular adhesion molecule 5-like isoform X2 [Stegostoma tigrinum]
MGFQIMSPHGLIQFLTITSYVTTNMAGIDIWVDINPQVLEFGHSLEANCSTSCVGSDVLIILEYKSGLTPHRQSGSKWIADFFPKVTAWDVSVPCFVRCNREQRSVKEVVTVYNREINITSLPEVLEVNRRYSLQCIGPRVYPNNKLILTWLRGSEIVQRNSREGQGLPDEDNRLRNVFNFTASLSDDGQEYTCLAEVDLGSNTTMSITNSSVTLQTYSFMDQPRILDKRPKEVKQEVILTCEVSDVYPVEKMRVRWFQDGEELNSVTTRPNSNTVQSTAAWTPQETGLIEVVCMADFEKYPSVPSKNHTVFIEVYVFSSPEIQIPTSHEGNLVNITCHVLNVSGDLELRLKKENDILAKGSSSTGLTISHTVQAQAKLDGQQFICEAELKLQDQSITSPVIKQQVGTLHVLYKPRDTFMTISVNNKTVSGFPVEVTKGDEITLSCMSDGRPSPVLEWVNPSNGNNIEIGPGFLRIPYITSEHQGIYICRATNQYGSDEKDVDIRVKGLKWIIVVTVGIAAVLTTAVVTALYQKFNARKRGEYNVQNAKPNNNAQIPNGHEYQKSFPLKKLDPYCGETITNGLNQ